MAFHNPFVKNGKITFPDGAGIVKHVERWAKVRGDRILAVDADPDGGRRRGLTGPDQQVREPVQPGGGDQVLFGLDDLDRAHPEPGEVRGHRPMNPDVEQLADLRPGVLLDPEPGGPLDGFEHGSGHG